MTTYTSSILAKRLDRVSNLILKLRQSLVFVSGLAKIKYIIASLKLFLSMPFEKTVLGVDITPSNIYLCKIRNNKNSPALTGLTSISIDGNFLFEDIQCNPTSYADSLRELLKSDKIETKKVSVLLPASSSIIKYATIPKMSDRKITHAINYGALWHNLMGEDSRLDDYAVSYQIIRKSRFSSTMDAIFIATRIADINLYNNIVINAGLEPVAIGSKLLALHYAFQTQILKNTVIIELGFNDNFVMVSGEEGPHIFDMPVTENERTAMLGDISSNDEEIINNLISHYQQKVEAIINSYKTIKPEITIKDIFIISSLPFVSRLVHKLNYSLRGCNIKECNMFGYISIPHNFSISKNSERNNVSAWSGALCIAVTAFNNHWKEWLEIKKPVCIKKLELNSLSENDDAFSPSFIAIVIAIFISLIISFSYYNLKDEEGQLAKSEADLNEIIIQYNEKLAQLASLEDVVEKMDILTEQSKTLAMENNQFYIISIYNYFDTILEHGVWMKQMTFTAPNHIEIEGRSLNGNNVMAFLGTINDSRMFSTVDLKHMQTITEMDLYRSKSVSLKSFILRGKLAENLPSDYLNKSGLNGKDIKKGK